MNFTYVCCEYEVDMGHQFNNFSRRWIKTLTHICKEIHSNKVASDQLMSVAVIHVQIDQVLTLTISNY